MLFPARCMLETGNRTAHRSWHHRQPQHRNRGGELKVGDQVIVGEASAANNASTSVTSPMRMRMVLMTARSFASAPAQILRDFAGMFPVEDVSLDIPEVNFAIMGPSGRANPFQTSWLSRRTQCRTYVLDGRSVPNCAGRAGVLRNRTSLRVSGFNLFAAHVAAGQCCAALIYCGVEHGNASGARTTCSPSGLETPPDANKIPRTQATRRDRPRLINNRAAAAENPRQPRQPHSEEIMTLFES